MTSNRKGWLDTLNSVKVYHNADYVDTPHQQNAEHTRFPVHHFGRLLTIWRFDGVEYDEGFTDEGTKHTNDFYGELQYNLSVHHEMAHADRFHVRNEGDALLFYDPYYVKNTDLNDGFPINLRGADSRYIHEKGSEFDKLKHGAADIIVTDSDQSGNVQLFKVIRIQEFPSSGDEEERGFMGGYHLAYLELFRDHHHFRKSDSESVKDAGLTHDHGDLIKSTKL